MNPARILFLLLALLSFAIPAIADPSCSQAYGQIRRSFPKYWDMQPEERWAKVETMLGHPLTDVQKQGLRGVHEIALKRAMNGESYTWTDLREKAEALRQLGFSRRDRELLMRNGVVGFFDDVIDNMASAQKFSSIMNGDSGGYFRAERDRDLAHGNFKGALVQDIRAQAADELFSGTFLGVAWLGR